MRAFQLNKLEEAFDEIQKEFEFVAQVQSIDILITKLDVINGYLAWSGEQMAIGKKIWNDAKEKAYRTLKTSSMANDKYYAPSLAKDYIISKCAIEGYGYDMAERLTRVLTHTAENLRTSISALKAQMQMEQYAQRVPLV